MVIDVPLDLQDDLWTVYNELEVQNYTMLHAIYSGTLDERKAIAYYQFGLYDDIYTDRLYVEMYPTGEGLTDTLVDTIAATYGANRQYRVHVDGKDCHLLIWSVDKTRSQLATTANAILTAYPTQVAHVGAEGWASANSITYDEYSADSSGGYSYSPFATSALNAWYTTRGNFISGSNEGEPVLIAVLDSGIDPYHEDLYVSSSTKSYVNIGESSVYQSNFGGRLEWYSGWQPTDDFPSYTEPELPQYPDFEPRSESKYEPWERYHKGENRPPEVTEPPVDEPDWVWEGSGHGTKSCSVIAALANDVGTTGIAPDAKVVPIRMAPTGNVVAGDPTGYDGLKFLKAADVLVDASSTYNIRVVSLGYDWPERYAHVETAVKHLVDAGIVLVATDTGNEPTSTGAGMGWPAKLSHVTSSTEFQHQHGVIAVSYLQWDGGFLDHYPNGNPIAESSWNGWPTTDIFAPSDHMMLADIDCGETHAENEHHPYIIADGVSFGIPAVASAVALAFAGGNVSINDVKEVLLNQSRPIYNFGPDANGDPFRQLDLAWMSKKHLHWPRISSKYWNLQAPNLPPLAGAMGDGTIVRGRYVPPFDYNGIGLGTEVPMMYFYEDYEEVDELLPLMPDPDDNGVYTSIPYIMPEGTTTGITPMIVLNHAKHMVVIADPPSVVYQTDFYERTRDQYGTWDFKLTPDLEYQESISTEREVTSLVCFESGGAFIFSDIPEPGTSTYQAPVLLSYGDVNANLGSLVSGQVVEIAKGNCCDQMLILTLDSGTYRIYRYTPDPDPLLDVPVQVTTYSASGNLVAVGALGGETGFAYMDSSSYVFNVAQVDDSGVCNWIMTNPYSPTANGWEFQGSPCEIQLTGYKVWQTELLPGKTFLPYLVVQCSDGTSMHTVEGVRFQWPVGMAGPDPGQYYVSRKEPIGEWLTYNSSITTAFQPEQVFIGEDDTIHQIAYVSKSVVIPDFIKLYTYIKCAELGSMEMFP